MGQSDLRKKISEMREWDEDELRMLDRALVKFPQVHGFNDVPTLTIQDHSKIKSSIASTLLLRLDYPHTLHTSSHGQTG